MRAIALLVVLALVAGCAGGKPDSADPSVSVSASAAPATVTQETGGIEGIVVNDESAPVPGADVGVVQTGNQTKSAKDGSFSFSDLQPGEYTVTVGALGFDSAAKKVMVVAGEITKADFALRAIAIDEGPVIELLPRRGYINCSINPYYSMNLCGNLMADQAHFPFSVRTDLKAKELSVELVFKPTSPAGSQQLELNLCDRIDNQTNQANCFTTTDFYAYKTGTSPIHIRTKEMPKDQVDYQVSVGAGQLGAGQPEVPLAFQQPFDVYISVCYLEDCPEEYQARPPE